MGDPSRYWQLVRLDGAGRTRREVVAEAKAFFEQQFPEAIASSDVADAPIQRQLFHLWKVEGEASGWAEQCFRCFISNLIEQVCLQFERQYGAKHGFTREDLLPFVLDDGRRSRVPPEAEAQRRYQSLSSEILRTFDPEKSTLSTWTVRLVKFHRELNAFLLEHGVYLMSDWAILNDTTPKQLTRILTEFYQLSPGEIQRASALLESYHATYLDDRLKQRQSGTAGRCSTPTTSQLQQMAHLLQEQTDHMLSPEAVFSRLQQLAKQLRNYRIHVRGGTLPVQSLDVSANYAIAAQMTTSGASDEPEEQSEFLGAYRQQFLAALDQAIVMVTGDRLGRVQRKDPEAGRQFVRALHLFQCQGKSMGEIATHVGLQAQYQVTRLLKLKELRADVRRHMLTQLHTFVLEVATTYADPTRLDNLNQQVEAALDEQISGLVQEAEAEASIAKNRPTKSLFARRLCHHLNHHFDALGGVS